MDWKRRVRGRPSGGGGEDGEVAWVVDVEVEG